MIASKKKPKAVRIDEALVALTERVGYARNSIDSLEKSINSNRDKDSEIENLRLENAGLRARLAAIVPILEVLLHDKVKPGFKQRLIGEGFREVPQEHRNPDTMSRERW